MFYFLFQDEAQFFFPISPFLRDANSINCVKHILVALSLIFVLYSTMYFYLIDNRVTEDSSFKIMHLKCMQRLGGVCVSFSRKLK